MRAGSYRVGRKQQPHNLFHKNILLCCSGSDQLYPICSGPKGPLGATGVVGAVGKRGAMGSSGATGLPGYDGYVGITGATGLPGSQPGPPGFPGPRGATGSLGETGIVNALRGVVFCHRKFYKLGASIDTLNPHIEC